MCSNSKRKMSVIATRNLPFANIGKRWVMVTFHGKQQKWMPSFEDLFRIIQALAICEDEKYPNGAGRIMLADFLNDCVYEDDWQYVSQKYKIPIRCGTEVKDNNGARIDNDG